jgi:uncharacterized membrane protein
LDVLLRMLEAMERIARHTKRCDDRRALEEHAKMVFDDALEAAGADRDRQKVERRYATFQRTAAASMESPPRDGGQCVASGSKELAAPSNVGTRN